MYLSGRHRAFMLEEQNLLNFSSSTLRVRTAHSLAEDSHLLNCQDLVCSFPGIAPRLRAGGFLHDETQQSVGLPPTFPFITRLGYLQNRRPQWSVHLPLSCFFHERREMYVQYAVSSPDAASSCSAARLVMWEGGAGACIYKASGFRSFPGSLQHTMRTLKR